jgi:type 1 glutamine amidotransferase
LIEARMPFEMLHDRTLDRAGRFKLLLLPNIAALSNEQCEQIRAFVENGGSVLATYQTSLFDENGAQRPDFGLAGLFGVSWRKTLDGPIPNSYLRVEETGRRHPLMKGLEDAELLINGTYQLAVEPTAQFEPPFLTAIPQYPSLPMEKNIWGVKKTDKPGVFLRRLGKGRVVYFPWDIDRVYWEVMVDDHGRLLRNAIDWALDEERPVTVAGLGMLDVTVWKQRSSMTVHLVNLTNPMTMRPSFRQIIPSPEQQVRLRLPAGARVSKVQLLVAGGTPAVQIVKGVLTLTVPSIRDHEVIAVDFV